MSKTIKATWTIELHCDCPRCGENVNLLDHADFWDNRQFEIGEHETGETEEVYVICPKCDADFEVNLEC